VTKRPDLSQEQSDELLSRVKNGEGMYALAREFDRYPSNLYKLLERRYGYVFPGKHSYWRPVLTLPTDAAQLGYLAGLIDGEGSLKRRSDGLWNISVGMTDETVIRWLESFGKCTFFINDPAPPRKRFYSWKINRRHDVLAFLKAIEPYMIVKRVVAQEAITELEERVAGAPFQDR
jgi:hypothetical protein